MSLNRMSECCHWLLIVLLALVEGCSYRRVVMPERLLEDQISSVPLVFPGAPLGSHSLELSDKPEESYRAWIQWLKEQPLPGPVTSLNLSLKEREHFDNGSRLWLPWMKQQADCGDVTAQVMLGVLLIQKFVSGEKAGQEQAEGMQWLKKATASGSSFAAWHWALIMLGSPEQADAARLDKLLHQAAKANDPQVFQTLARLYRDGDNLVQNREASAEWYSKLESNFHKSNSHENKSHKSNTHKRKAQKNITRNPCLENDARINLGLMAWFGIGMKRDKTDAEKQWRKAAANGSGYAAYFAALATENDGHALLKKASTAMVAEAFNQRGYLLWNKGKFIEAAVQFEQGVQAGDILAVYNSGVSYYTGKGQTPNPYKALVMFSRASVQGDRHSLRLQGFLNWQGPEQVPVDYARARAAFVRAASMGDLYSYYALGLMAAIGQGEPRDLVTAWSHLALVAAWGVPEAATLRDIVVEKMTQQQKSVARKQAQILFDNCKNMSVYLDIERQPSAIRAALAKPKR